MEVVVVTLPLPPAELSPNSHKWKHWGGRHRAFQKYKESAWAEALVASKGKRPKWSKANVQCIFYFAEKRNRDGDNLIGWMKAAFDGIAAAGIMANDCGMIHYPPRIGIDSDNPRVSVFIKPAA